MVVEHIHVYVLHVHVQQGLLTREGRGHGYMKVMCTAKFNLPYIVRYTVHVHSSLVKDFLSTCK